MFPTDMPGNPPIHEIEFAIDLEPNTRRISMTHYCMAPANIKELNSYLQDLLGKGFIRLSMSP